MCIYGYHFSCEEFLKIFYPDVFKEVQESDDIPFSECCTFFHYSLLRHGKEYRKQYRKELVEWNKKEGPHLVMDIIAVNDHVLFEGKGDHVFVGISPNLNSPLGEVLIFDPEEMKEQLKEALKKLPEKTQEYFLFLERPTQFMFFPDDFYFFS